MIGNEEVTGKDETEEVMRNDGENDEVMGRQEGLQQGVRVMACVWEAGWSSEAVCVSGT